MLAFTPHFFRGATPHKLRLHLRRLRAVSKAAQQELYRRRRRLRSAQQECSGSSTASSSPSACSGMRAEWLPKNDALESAIALAISENRDARTELEFTRHFLTGSYLSLASPVDNWDPYDTKPQVFAFDKYVALPVFTSLAYLRLFCRQFRFTVRDPSGVLWADGAAEAERTGMMDDTVPLPDVSKSEWWERHVQQRLRATALEPMRPPADEQEIRAVESTGGAADTFWPQAVDLFGCMDAAPTEATGTSQQKEQAPKRKQRATRVRRRREKIFRSSGHIGNRRAWEGGGKTSQEGDAGLGYDAIKAAFWDKVRSTAPFRIKQVTPLPVFGPLLRPFFVGYFADVDTLLHNASIVPANVDIVLNPTSPIEFVLAREATDCVLHGDKLLHLAYRRVEKELRGEFHRYFRHFSPEVVWARSACVPSPVPGKLDGVMYTLVILLQSDDFPQTYAALRAAKRHCLLMGHSDLDVLPWDAAAPHVREASSLFYERDAATGDTCCGVQGGLGVFEQKGPVQTISVAQPADSFYHDPTAAYTESHAVFTEELKLRRRVQ
ncbi:hypothetical protein TraAM80_05334 [Trypanosoma rangeli]|uniref:Uncharacterized protein n=1 Tax=Trypanosoma rangeli TaxID=5698 RepID=A0A3R7NBZ9_TRYRA|nr:uncharacterized protein TraAM80_05334 [Trypanosoma rangeli]RNF04057.1 hypothetical protein TraAM80_05334 [Trypanosoma rangeli]|eukprot:RNF04057.1 hypothetical protein TraAM80_05334 [Trypanosoma rangeli]